MANNVKVKDNESIKPTEFKNQILKCKNTNQSLKRKNKRKTHLIYNEKRFIFFAVKENDNFTF